jgi:glycerophosphoryl diester phosphodiesterase
MKIIGHRGGAKIVPENSLKAIRIAKNLGIDGIEIDVRLTRDKELVVFHDPTLSRLSDSDKKISDLTAANVRKIKLKNNETIPLLDEFIKERSGLMLYVEGKDNGWAAILAEKLLKLPNNKGISVISFNHVELGHFKELSPRTKTYALSIYGLDALSAAKRLGLSGISVFYPALFNPYLAWQIKKSGLELNTFPINNLFIAETISKVFPNISITTDSPDRLKKQTKRIR